MFWVKWCIRKETGTFCTSWNLFKLELDSAFNLTNQKLGPPLHLCNRLSSN